MKLFLTDAAQADIAEIYACSRKRWGVAQARSYALDLRSMLKCFAAGQTAGLAAPDIRPGMRCQLSGSHVIWFRAEPGLLRVIRVLHQSRDAGRWIG